MPATEPSQRPPDPPQPSLARVRVLVASIDALLPVAGAAAVVISSAVLIAALFLPWYDLPVALPSRSDGEFSRIPSPPSGWESFRYADVLLASIAAIGAGSALLALWLRFRAPFGVSALAGWIGVAIVIYSYHRPVFGPSPASSPAEGYFVALCATGAIGGASLVALLAESRSGTSKGDP